MKQKDKDKQEELYQSPPSKENVFSVCLVLWLLIFMHTIYFSLLCIKTDWAIPSQLEIAVKYQIAILEELFISIF